MRALKPVCAILFTAFSFSASATNYKFVAGDKTSATKICLAALSDKPIRLLRALNYLEASSTIPQVKLRIVAQHQTCNNTNIALFASQYGAKKTTKMLARHLKSSITIRQEIADNLENPRIESNEEKVVVITGS